MLLKCILLGVLSAVSLADDQASAPKFAPDIAHFDDTQTSVAKADKLEHLHLIKYLRDGLALRESEEFLADKEKFIQGKLKEYGVKGHEINEEWRQSFEATDEWKSFYNQYNGKEGRVSAEVDTSGIQCYQPVPYPSSNCCMQCKTYGVLVNAGKLSPHTPCAPPNSWSKCSETGCNGKIGTCKCERTTNIGYLAIIYDLTKDALFFAESDDAGPSCVMCGDKQKESSHFRSFVETDLKLGQCPYCGVPTKVTVGCSHFASCPTSYVKDKDLSKRDCILWAKKYECVQPFCLR